jgi:alpha-tubulin suppressor-like RCC1 family protein
VSAGPTFGRLNGERREGVEVRVGARLLAAGVVVVSAAFPGGAALAASRAVTTHVVVHATPATALIGSLVVVTGTDKPVLAHGAVTVERLVGKRWKVVAHAKSSRAGAFSVSLRAPKSASTVTLRVVRPATRTLKAGVSRRLTIHVVKAHYVVSASTASDVVAGSPVVVTGVVHPRATGSVVLQWLKGTTWVPLATAKLTRASTFTIGATRPLGAYRLRVVKAFSATVAAGTSASFGTTVVGPLAITTAALPGARARAPYAATLAASGGEPPYTWTAAGLPAGVAVTTAGVLSGEPAAAGSATITATVRDADGRVASGTFPVAIAVAHGQVWAWGAAAMELTSALTQVSTPIKVPGLTDAIAVASSQSNGYAIRADGSLVAWGGNDYGQIGDGTTARRDSPVAVSRLSGVVQVSAGEQDAMALLADGTVWTWGANVSGQLGLGDLQLRSAPTQVPGLTGIKAIAAGDGTDFALAGDGTVSAWGDDHVGQVGDGDNTGTNKLSPVKVSGLTGVTAIAGGGGGGYALLSDGTVRAWGDNNVGELGDAAAGTFSNVPVTVAGLTGVTAIVAGTYDGYARLADGTVRAWGGYTHGELGAGDGAPTTPTSQVNGLAAVVALAGGGGCGFALLADGTVRSWGDNNDGDLGNGTLTMSDVPVAVSGLSRTVAIGSGNAGSGGVAITSP